MDNLVPATADNATTQTVTTGIPASTTVTSTPPTQTVPDFNWKNQLATDFQNSPTIKKFADNKDGFNEAVKSHLSLEKLLGHEKVPVPKGKDDVEGWAVFSKAMGIPEKAEGYGLQDAKLPDHIKGLSFDKTKFADIVHKHKLTPDAAKGLWNDYTEMMGQIYQNAVKEQETKMTGVINQMRGEWGDAYQTKVELGQMVINKFSDDKEMNDFITSTLASDPRGIKFLAKVGDQFAENKIGEFKNARHSLTPDEAQREIQQIRQDPNHPYNNDKASPAERDKAIDYVNGLLTLTRKSKG